MDEMCVARVSTEISSKRMLIFLFHFLTYYLLCYFYLVFLLLSYDFLNKQSCEKRVPFSARFKLQLVSCWEFTNSLCFIEYRLPISRRFFFLFLWIERAWMRFFCMYKRTKGCERRRVASGDPKACKKVS